MNLAEVLYQALDAIYGDPENDSETCMVYLLMRRMMNLFLEVGATPKEASEACENLEALIFAPLLGKPLND